LDVQVDGQMPDQVPGATPGTRLVDRQLFFKSAQLILEGSALFLHRLLNLLSRKLIQREIQLIAFPNQGDDIESVSRLGQVNGEYRDFAT
jgi:hypothetical protein